MSGLNDHTPDPRGVVFGLLAYLWWGLSPLFWKQLDHVGAVDILGWRVVSTFILVSLLVLFTRRWDEVAEAASTRVGRLASATAALLIAVNWSVFVWAVGAERVTEASLGYFMNPLMSVFLGVVVLGETLRRAQWTAVVFAAVGVGWLTLVVGTVPWVSLALATTFAIYGLIRKLAPAGPLIGLNLEMTLLLVPAVILIMSRWHWSDIALRQEPETMAWLALTGVITAAPLIWFVAAARRIPLWLVGLLQFIAPTIQFLLGVLVYDEPFTGEMLVGYGIIWAGLAVFVIDGLRVTNAARRAAVAASSTR